MNVATGAIVAHRQDGLVLLPAQLAALADLEKVVPLAPITILGGRSRFGMTTVLRSFAERHGARFVSMSDAMPTAKRGAPETSDARVVRYLRDLVAANETVVLDGLEMAAHNWRVGGEQMLVGDLFELVREKGHRLIIGGTWRTNHLIERSAHRVRWAMLGSFGPRDLEAFLSVACAGVPLSGVDFDLVARRVGHFDIYDLLNLAHRLAGMAALSTEAVARELFAIKGRGNVSLGEVEELDFKSLPGTDHIARALETHVVLPHEHPELARRLDIRPKRGVLLYGPPGSGKTSIGRALAHRMHGKFFLIDGSIPTEPPADFFAAIKAIVEEARLNAPSVLFIDDADVLFGIIHISGFARYLLTLLDGMESESAAKVCVVMTAMNANKIPQPILRSGRVELWLETRPPDHATRAAIFERWLDVSLPESQGVDFGALSERADGCTPADIRRVIGDARSLFAADRLAGRAAADAQSYLERSLDDLVATRERMAQHLRDDTLRVGTMRASSKYAAGIGGIVESATTCVTSKW